uniref:Transcriptional regulator n=1 Tax=Steinernema glaseri TaxID=37863 RepID=A0A1I8APK0_9BILA
MDGVPTAFFRHLCDTLYSNGLSEAEKLSGQLGQLALIAYCHRTVYQAVVEDGFERSGHLLYCRSRHVLYGWEEIEAVPKKFVRHVL